MVLNSSRQSGPKEAAATCRELAATWRKLAGPRGGLDSEPSACHQGLVGGDRGQDWCLPLLMEACCLLEGRIGKICSQVASRCRCVTFPRCSGFLASPSLHSWLCVSGSEVPLEEVGLHPRMLSATQISCLKKRIPAARLPASSLSFLLPPLHSPPLLLPPLLPSFLQLFHFSLPPSTNHHGALTLTRSRASPGKKKMSKHSPWFGDTPSQKETNRCTKSVYNMIHSPQEHSAPSAPRANNVSAQ